MGLLTSLLSIFRTSQGSTSETSPAAEEEYKGLSGLINADYRDTVFKMMINSREKEGEKFIHELYRDVTEKSLIREGEFSQIAVKCCTK